MSKKQLVAVVIPIYTRTLTEQETISLTQTVKVLGHYPLYVACPDNLDTLWLEQRFPQLQFRYFAPEFFRNIIGYNKLMLSEVFYQSFEDFEYILIDQLDVYVFKDELVEWCHKGYDYIGAPWLKRDVYDKPLVKQILNVWTWWNRQRNRRSQLDRYNKVGNGGFSLRRVESHLRVLREIPDTVRIYAEVNNRKHLFNEDTFWAMEPCGFRYPSVEEAMLFSYNKYPELSYKRTGGKTPFGCHGWTKPKYREFWCRNTEYPTMP